MANWTYGGTASSPVPTSSTNGTSNVTYKYKGRGSTTYAESTTKPTNAGTYTVTATFAATSNYNAVTATANFTINRQSVAEPSCTSATYNGSSQTLLAAKTSGGYTNEAITGTNA